MFLYEILYEGVLSDKLDEVKSKIKEREEQKERINKNNLKFNKSITNKAELLKALTGNPNLLTRRESITECYKIIFG